MKGSTKRAAALLLAVGLTVGAAGPARAQVLPDEMRTMVFLLLDSSGSMEYDLRQPSSQVPFPLPDCPAPAPAGFEYAKNRWLIAMEALTGVVRERSCVYDLRQDPAREDFGYAVAHVQWSYAGQNDDGLLDILRDEITFGLFTFDSLTKEDLDASGDFSFYYGSAAGSAGGLNVDWGVKNRSATRGGLVDPTVADTVGALRLVNDLIQQRIASVIPHRGGPTGAALADIIAYVENDDRMKPKTDERPLGDPFASCRPRHVILVTDGRPSNDGRFGYARSTAAAQELLTEHGIKTHVVGFAVQSAVDLVALDSIAFYGGTDKAHIANNQVQLVGTLAAVLGELTTGVESRTLPAFTLATRNQPEDKQYRFFAARTSISGNPVDREGILEQEIWGCRASCRSEDNEGSVDLCEILDLGTVLNNRMDDRKLHTVLTDPTTPGSFTVESLDASNAALTPEALAVPEVDEYPHVGMFIGNTGAEMPFGHVIGERSDGTIDPLVTRQEKKEEYVRQLIEYVHGNPGSRREDHRLGAIFRSSPTVQAAPSLWLSGRGSYRCYAREHADRPTVLYTFTHDGVFHAFRVDRPSTLTREKYGEELWGFVPGFALRSLRLLDDAFLQLGDGEPVISEVLPVRLDADATVEEECPEWRSVGVVPAGAHGRGVFALDLTDPEEWNDAMFLWEITPEGRCWGPGGGLCEPYSAGNQSDFRNLGYQKSHPAIGTIYLDNGTAAEERALAFFAGGDDPEDEGIGRSFFVVDLMTGEKIAEFSDANANIDGGPLNAVLSDHPIVGTPVVYATGIGKFVSRIFVGDAGGRLWRIRIESTDPDDWRMELFHDAYGTIPVDSPVRAPIWDPPAVAASRHRGRLVVVYATGNLDAEGTAGTRTMFSLIETRIGTTIEASTNWYYDFPEGEQPVGEPVIFDGTVYFTSYVQPDDLCDTGKTRLWAIDYMETEAGGALMPKLDADGDIFTVEAAVLYEEFDDTIPQGVRVTQAPSCDFSVSEYLENDDGGPRQKLRPLDDSFFGGPNAGAPGGGAPGAGGMRVVMQKGGSPATDGQAQPPAGAPGASEARIARSSSTTLSMPSVQVTFESWATIFD